VVTTEELVQERKGLRASRDLLEFKVLKEVKV
jgi:hypothetical protein